MEKKIFTRKHILRQAYQELVMSTQWYGDHESLHSSLEHTAKAAALIELLEVLDCGSTGGFDRGNPLPGLCKYVLMDRFLCVRNKYNRGWEPFPDFPIAEITARFNRLKGVMEG